jgi:Ca2+-transporting ATPase
VGIQGIMFAALTLAGFYIAKGATGSLEAGRTIAFLVLSLSQIVQAYNMRSDHSLFTIGFFGNKNLNNACLLSVMLVTLVLFTPLAQPFELVQGLPWWLYLAGIGLSLVPLPVLEAFKAIGIIRHRH